METMVPFLRQMTLTVKNGDQTIYSGVASEAGTLAEGVLLGRLERNESLELNANLEVPLDMGNDFANRVGEVDWVFKVEAFDYPTPPTTDSQLTVRKVWEGDQAKDRPSQVTVNLLKDGKVQETQVLNASNQWTYTWGNLSRWNKWSVEEANVPEGYAASYETTGNTTVITNTKTVAAGDVTVKKVWKGDSKDRPSSVKVQLYRDGEVYDTATLKKSTGWTYTWDDLDADGDWKVVEDQVPKGYVPSYRVKKGVVTVTNTAKLIQTGQRNWPVLLCGGLGVLVLAAGVILILRGRKKEHA